MPEMIVTFPDTNISLLISHHKSLVPVLVGLVGGSEVIGTVKKLSIGDGGKIL